MKKLEERLFVTLGVMVLTISIAIYMQKLGLDYLETDESMYNSCIKFAWLSMGICMTSIIRFIKLAYKIEQTR